MERIEFIRFRSILGKTQSEIAQLLGVSVKAVHSYEQGWRSIPGHVQRQILLLVQRKQHVDQPSLPCWTKTACPEALRRSCPAWEFQGGDICWFLSGTFCKGRSFRNWKEKMAECRMCNVFAGIFPPQE